MKKESPSGNVGVQPHAVAAQHAAENLETS